MIKLFILALATGFPITKEKFDIEGDDESSIENWLWGDHYSMQASSDLATIAIFTEREISTIAETPAAVTMKPAMRALKIINDCGCIEKCRFKCNQPSSS